MPELTLRTPAKINPVLDILARRPDGFHELFMHMVPVSVFDELEFTLAASSHLEVAGADFSGELQENLVFQALKAFEEASGRPQTWHVVLRKAIPSGAGLGGGSSDAAATLKALNQLNRSPLGISELWQLAQKLGSDVPFFLDPRPCAVRGRGERVDPLEGYPEAELLLITPPFAISTAQAYRGCLPKIQEPPPLPQSTAELASILRNQFEASLIPQFPELERLQKLLRGHGAIGASVSGSGSTVFGVFPDHQARDQAFAQLQGLALGRMFCCRILLHPQEP
jgi:4-diphosphocytidyl-2-C-methyl-D-erythritol kinase